MTSERAGSAPEGKAASAVFSTSGSGDRTAMASTTPEGAVVEMA
jgi:hypothetical protein